MSAPRNSEILTDFDQNSSLIWPEVTHFWSDFETHQLTRLISKIGFEGLKIELRGQTRAEIEALEKAHLIDLLVMNMNDFLESKTDIWESKNTKHETFSDNKSDLDLTLQILNARVLQYSPHFINFSSTRL